MFKVWLSSSLATSPVPAVRGLKVSFEVFDVLHFSEYPSDAALKTMGAMVVTGSSTSVLIFRFVRLVPMC